MTDLSNLYSILGMSSNNIIESILIEGYNIDDIYYYIMTNYKQFEQQYPFIYKISCNLIDIYKKQYKMDPSLNNFKVLIDSCDELGNNFLRIIEYFKKDTINACSYYQNNKKTISLKNDNPKQSTISILDITNQPNQPNQPNQLPIIKPQIQIKSKIAIKRK